MVGLLGSLGFSKSTMTSYMLCFLFVIVVNVTSTVEGEISFEKCFLFLLCAWELGASFNQAQKFKLVLQAVSKHVAQQVAQKFALIPFLCSVQEENCTVLILKHVKCFNSFLKVSYDFCGNMRRSGSQNKIFITIEQKG